MRRKLGLAREDDDDFALATDFLAGMEGQEGGVGADFTLAFRRLADVAEGKGNLSEIGLHKLYSDDAALRAWLQRWQARIATESVTPAQRAQTMRAVNPVYIPRNHRVEEALAAAVDLGDFAPFEKLLQVLADPWTDKIEYAGYAQPATQEESAGYRTFCGT